MLPSLDVTYIIISAFTFALYSILVKKIPPKDMLICLFWVHTITYLGFLSIYLFRKFALAHDVFAIEQLIHEYTFYNAPLYILIGITFLGSLLLYHKLIAEYPVSQVLPFAQISLLFIMTGYLLLGDPFSLSAFIGVLIVCFGSIISAIESFHWPNVFEPIRKLPRGLVIGILCEAVLITVNALITFFVTQKTPIDEYVMGSLKHIFPFSFYNPFYFNLGARFFIMITFLIYLFQSNKYQGRIIKTLRENFMNILLIGVIYLTSAYTYQDAYFLTKDLNVLAALSKLSIPIVLLLSVLLLDEKLTLQKIIGSVLIVGGGAIALLF